MQHAIRSFDFELRYLNRDDAVRSGDESIGRQVFIPHVLPGGSWLPSSWESTFIEPGLSTRYSQITSVPASASFLLLHGRFVYGDGSAVHTADRFVAVPAAMNERETPVDS